MEPEKENLVLENKPDSSVPKDGSDNKNDDIIVEQKSDLAQDTPQINENDTQSTAEIKPEIEIKPGTDQIKAENVESNLDSEIKQEEKEENPPDESNIEETPYVPPDLNKVSEEIDQYISTLMSAPKDDDNESNTTPDMPICVEQFVVLVESKIEQYDSHESHVKWSQLTDEDSASFLDVVNRVSSLSKALSEYSSDFKYAYNINCTGGVLQRLMSYMEEEFKILLEDYKIHDSDPDPNKLDNDATKPNPNPETEQNSPPKSPKTKENTFPGYSDEVLSNLVKLSKAMFAGGYDKECCQVYFVARRTALEESLHKLGFEKFSIDDVQRMYWESLEREIEAWIKTFKQCSTVQFSGERKLSESVFSGHPSISDTVFGSLSHGVMIQLLNFAEAVALTKRAPEKLFKFLDLYEALRDVLPAIEGVIPEEWANQLKTDVSMIRTRLGEAMILIVVELENAIKSDSAKTPVPGGAVHPLTKYIMNYLTYACEYRETLEQVFREHQKIERADSATGSEFNAETQSYSNNNSNQSVIKQSPFQAQVIKVMDLLDSYVEGKSKLYRDISLSSIFLMNNGRYILQKIKGSNELKALMDDSWCRKKSSELRQYHKGYQRETWGKLLTCLNPEGLLTNGKVVKPVLKERFNSFNKLFDEIHKTQTTWVVGDEQLQSELRVSISNMVIPAYRSFLGRFSQVFTPGRQTEKYVKFQPEDIETYIDELFDGNAAPVGKRKM